MHVTFQSHARKSRILATKRVTVAATNGGTRVKIAGILTHNSSRNIETFCKKIVKQNQTYGIRDYSWHPVDDGTLCVDHCALLERT